MNDRQRQTPAEAPGRPERRGVLWTLVTFLGRLLAVLVGLVLFWRMRARRAVPTCDAESLGRNFGQLALLGTGLLVGTGVIVAILWVSLVYYPIHQLSSGQQPPPLVDRALLQAVPRLSDTTAESVEALRREKLEILNSYGWVNREDGVVRIPIERAIELLAERGWPTRSEREAREAGGSE